MAALALSGWNPDDRNQAQQTMADEGCGIHTEFPVCHPRYVHEHGALLCSQEPMRNERQSLRARATGWPCQSDLDWCQQTHRAALVEVHSVSYTQ